MGQNSLRQARWLGPSDGRLMLGIITFGLLAAGLGNLHPRRASADDCPLGLRFTVGAALLILALFFLTVPLSLALRPATAVVAGVALIGWLAGLSRSDRPTV